MNFSNRALYTGLLTFLVFTFIFTLFYHVNQAPIHSWDESRHGVSALEMLHAHNYVINTWMGKPDMWNLKPVLSFLPTCLSFLLLGKSLLALRLFSILSAIALALTICLYCLKKYNVFTTLIFIALLLTASLIITNHAFRSGDADSFFLLCQIVVILSLCNKQNTISITLAAFFSALAFLTKSWHALFMGTPYLIAYYFLFKDKKLSVKSFGFPILAFFLPILLWLAVRYTYDGFTFLKEMYEYDLVKRSTHVITDTEYHDGYYLKILFQRFLVIAIAFFFSLGYSFYIRKWKFLTRDSIILLSAILSSFIIYSLATTKLYWYGYTHIILMGLTSAVLIGRDLKPQTRLIPCILAACAFLYNLHTLYDLSRTTAPLRYYQTLRMHAYPAYPLIYAPTDITQDERMAFMIFGNFNDDAIKQGTPSRPALVFYKDTATGNPDITGCQQISEEKTPYKLRKRIETVRLYSCLPQ